MTWYNVLGVWILMSMCIMNNQEWTFIYNCYISQKYITSTLICPPRSFIVISILSTWQNLTQFTHIEKNNFPIFEQETCTVWRRSCIFIGRTIYGDENHWYMNDKVILWYHSIIKKHEVLHKNAFLAAILKFSKVKQVTLTILKNEIVKWMNLWIQRTLKHKTNP